MTFQGRDDMDAVVIHGLDDLFSDVAGVIPQPLQNKVLPQSSTQNCGYGPLLAITKFQRLLDLIGQ